MAPTMACPEICATIGVTVVCRLRSLTLSAGILMACWSTAEVLVTKAPLPL